MTSRVLADGLVRVETSGRWTQAVLDRPRARNAISAPMLAALLEVARDTRSDGTAVLTISGTGPAFCAGADIRGYAAAGEDSASLRAFTRTAVELCRTLEESDAIVVGALHGACLGGGFEIALSCDLVLAAEDTVLGLPELALGLIPGWGGTQRLTRVVGPAVARSMILGSRTLTAREAERLGIVSAVVPTDDLPAALAAQAARLAGGPTRALTAAKRAIAAAAPLPVGGAELETRLLSELFGSADGREGVAAFVEKRPPDFRGA